MLLCYASVISHVNWLGRPQAFTCLRNEITRIQFSISATQNTCHSRPEFARIETECWLSNILL